MNRALKSAAKISLLSTLAIAPVLLSHSAASAKPTGTDANYVGAGVAAGVTNGGQNGDAATFGGTLVGRYKIQNTPLSARGAVIFSGETSAIMPMISYDVPITNNANAYVAGGYSLVEKDGAPTPIGNKNAPVVAAGVEAEVAKNVVVFSDVKLGIKAYENSPASAVSINGGVGYSF